MIHERTFGAIINILGSVCINLGTNLMKLSHKVARGEIPPTPGISDARGKPSASSTSARDVGTEASGNNGQTIPQRCLDRSYSAADHFPNRRDLEMVPLLAAESTPPVHQPDADSSSSREASTTDPRRAEVQVIVETVKTMAGIKKDMEHMEQLQEGEGKYETSTSRVIKVDTLTASLSTAAGTSVSSDDKAALLGERTADVFDSPSVVSNRDQRNGRYRYPEEGASRRNSGVAVSQDVAVADGFEDRAGVRRRSFSNPYTGVLASRDDSRPATGSGKFVREKKALWCAGAVLLVVGSLVNFASFGFAPQSLLASLGSVQFVSNVVFGKAILREMVTRRILMGTLTIIVGNTLTLCFSPHQVGSFDTQQLRAFYDLEYMALLLLELCLALVVHATYRAFKSSKDVGSPRRFSDVVMPLAYAACSAIVGTQSVIQAKCLSELLNMTFQGENQMASPFTYVVIAVWVGTTIFWFMRMNRALAMFHGLFIIPALQVFWTFFSLVGGGVYFEEFKFLRPLGASLFALGVLVVFLGVSLLAPRSQTDLGKREVEDRDSDAHLRPPGLEAASSVSVSMPHGRTSPTHARRFSRASSLEAGDENMDRELPRMLSLGFFPSVSTDEDLRRLTDALRVIEPGNVVQRLKSLKGDGQSDIADGRKSEHLWETPPRPAPFSDCVNGGASSRDRDAVSEEV